MNKRNSRYEDWHRLEQLSGGDILPEKNLLLINTVRFHESSGQRESLVILRDLRSGSETLITAGGKQEGCARFTPDGLAVTFLSAGPEGRQLYRYTLADASVTRLTDLHQPIIDPLLSPDGSRLLFASPSSGSQKPAVDEPVVIEQLNYKFDGQGFSRPDSFLQLWVYNFETGRLIRLTDTPHHYLHHNWMPDSRSVVCGSGCFRSNENALAMDLIRIFLDGTKTRLSDRQWMVSYPNPLRPVPSPDGSFVYAGFLTEEIRAEAGDEQDYPDVVLCRVHADGGGMETIFEASDSCYQCVQFPYNAGCGGGFDKLTVSEDGETLYFFSGWQGRGQLYQIESCGGTAKLLLTGKKVWNGISKIRGKIALVSCSEPDVPEAWYLLDTGKNTTVKVFQSSEALLSETAFCGAEDFFFDTLDGRGRVHGWVQEPQNRVPGEKVPAILYIHGGPHPFYTYGFTMEHQLLAAAGFAVLYCNPRGSSGYGRNHQSMKMAFGTEAFTDLLQFTEEACRRFDWIDRDRIGVTGGSYGGYMVNCLASRTDRFRAYVSQRSVASKLVSYASSDMPGSSKTYQHFEEFLLRELEASPFAYADQISRPFLILHGEDDLRTPLEGAHQLFTAIKDCHPELPCKMVIFPHTAHSQPEHPVLKKRYFEELLHWFQTYL